MITIEAMCKTYLMGQAEIKALDKVDLSIEQNEFVAVMGTSGSGKSTLMNILGCLDKPDHGSYQLAGREVSGLSDDELSEVRNSDIGFVFQTFNLQARRTALENVMIPLRFANFSKTDAKDRAMEMLKRVGLANRSDHRPFELSGGQRQRVAIARALVNHPKVILADEPTGNLDSKTSDYIMQMFNELHAEGQTIVMVTHEDDIANHAQRKIVLKDGKIQNEYGQHD